MKRLAFWLVLLMLALSACRTVAPTVEIQPVKSTDFEPGATPTLSTEKPTEQSLPTATASPIHLPTTTPTETPLPPLTLPTPQPDAPAREVWDGQPTSPAESVPGLYFRLTFDPGIWALTVDQFGTPALGHRYIPYCVISPASGRGLAMDWRVEHEIRQYGALFFDVSFAYESGQLRFVTYLGGDGQVNTGFEISFDEAVETCLADAEAVIRTMVSIPEAEATVIP